MKVVQKAVFVDTATTPDLEELNQELSQDGHISSMNEVPGGIIYIVQKVVNEENTNG